MAGVENTMGMDVGVGVGAKVGTDRLVQRSRDHGPSKMVQSLSVFLSLSETGLLKENQPPAFQAQSPKRERERENFMFAPHSQPGSMHGGMMLVRSKATQPPAANRDTLIPLFVPVFFFPLLSSPLRASQSPPLRLMYMPWYRVIPQ